MGDAADDRGMKRTFIVPTIKSFDHYDFTRAKIDLVAVELNFNIVFLFSHCVCRVPIWL